MLRNRAYSDPVSPNATPNLPSSTTFISHLRSEQVNLNDYDVVGNRASRTGSGHISVRPTPLSQASLAAHTAQTSAPLRPAIPDYSLFTHSYSGSYLHNSLDENVYAGLRTGGNRRARAPSITPSETSMSDMEDADEEQNDKATLEETTKRMQEMGLVMKSWLGKGKGKAKAADIDTGGKAGSLPPEILGQIFRLVSDPRDLLSILLTSKSWCLAAFHLLWQKPNLTSTHQLAMFVRVIKSRKLTLPYATQVRRLYLAGLSDGLTDNLLVGLEKCHRMERLTLSKATGLTNQALRRIIEGMPDLVAIDLCEVGGTDDTVVKTIAERCSRIQGLNLSGCKSVGDEGVLAIATKSKLLRRVSVRSRDN